MFLFNGGLHAKTIQLTYSVFFPPNHGQCKAAVSWAKEVENRTQGRIKITVFPGGTLTKANRCYEGVTKGISDLGMSCFAYSTGRFPVMAAVDLPLGYPDGMVASRVANDFYEKIRPAELNGVKVLYLHAHGPGLLHTKKPVQHLENLTTLKIRSTGLSAKVVKALGGVPVAMPQGATYESLQKGVVDGTFGPIEVLKGWKQAEVVRHTTDCRDVGYTTAMYVVMNLKKWKQIPPDLQRIVEDVSRDWIQVHGAQWKALDKEGRDYTLSRGNDILTLSREEQGKWTQAVKPIIQAYISNVEEKGLGGTRYVEVLQHLISGHTQPTNAK